MAGSEVKWKLLCVVRVYKDVWDLYLEDDKHERCNPWNKYAIGVLLAIAFPLLYSRHFLGSEGCSNIVLCSNTAKVVHQGCHLACAQHTHVLSYYAHSLIMNM